MGVLIEEPGFYMIISIYDKESTDLRVPKLKRNQETLVNIITSTIYFLMDSRNFIGLLSIWQFLKSGEREKKGHLHFLITNVLGFDRDRLLHSHKTKNLQ